MDDKCLKCGKCDQVLIWKKPARLWYRPNRSGYTTLVFEAGRYWRCEAEADVLSADGDLVLDSPAMAPLRDQISDVAILANRHIAVLDAAIDRLRGIVDKATCYSYAIIPAGEPLLDGTGPRNRDYALVIVQRRTRYGERKWAVLLIPDGSSPVPGDRILGIDGTWGEEPQPSSRRAAFLAQFRFDSLDAAWQAAKENKSCQSE